MAKVIWLGQIAIGIIGQKLFEKTKSRRIKKMRSRTMSKNNGPPATARQSNNKMGSRERGPGLLGLWPVVRDPQTLFA